jgi:RNA polymerase sigma-70 factor (ECF subfamily)
MEDRKIVDLYFARSEEAIKETDKKYGKYCHYIAYQILSDNEDAREIVNDTYLKVWNTVPPQEPIPLKPYVGMISRQFSINEYARKHRKKRGGQMPLLLGELAECLPSEASPTDETEMLATRDALNRFLATLPEQTLKIFVRRYWYASTVEEIAREYGMKKSAVGMTLLRTREKLREFLKKEGIDYDR